MHSNVYTHKTVKAIEYMVTDILALADPYLPIRDSKGGTTRISQAMMDPVAYLTLKDSVLDLIECNPDERLRPAQALIKRLRKRELYKCVKAFPVSDSEVAQRFWRDSDENHVREAIAAKAREIWKNEIIRVGGEKGNFGL